MDEPVARYFDKQVQREAAKILPGQYHAATDDIVIVTVLGSCVSACLWDPLRRIGGMNHFMLPGASGHANPLRGGVHASATLGVYAMEVLINRMLKLGAERSRLVAKVFGGARLLAGFERLDVGAKNCEFVLEFLRVEGIRILAQDLLDVCPRKVHFFVDTGKVQVKRLALTPSESVEKRERDYLRRLDGKRSGDVEIFSPPR